MTTDIGNGRHQKPMWNMTSGFPVIKSLPALPVRTACRAFSLYHNNSKKQAPATQKPRFDFADDRGRVSCLPVITLIFNVFLLHRDGTNGNNSPESMHVNADELNDSGLHFLLIILWRKKE